MSEEVKPIHGYKAFFNGKETDIYAESSYQAKMKAVEFFKPRKNKEHMVHVLLCEKNVDRRGGRLHCIIQYSRPVQVPQEPGTLFMRLQEM